MQEKTMLQIWKEANAARAAAARDVDDMATQVVTKFIELVRADGLNVEFTRFEQSDDPFSIYRACVISAPSDGSLEFGMGAIIAKLKVVFRVVYRAKNHYSLVYRDEQATFKDADTAARSLYEKVCDHLITSTPSVS